MANWAVLKAAVANIIKTNGNQQITGQLLQNTLNNIISSVGENATFVGVATPTTNPGSPDGPVFYFATKAGNYANFGGAQLNDGLNILSWNGQTWAVNTVSENLDQAVSSIGYIDLTVPANSSTYYYVGASGLTTIKHAVFVHPNEKILLEIDGSDTDASVFSVEFKDTSSESIIKRLSLIGVSKIELSYEGNLDSVCLRFNVRNNSNSINIKIYRGGLYDLNARIRPYLTPIWELGAFDGHGSDVNATNRIRTQTLSLGAFAVTYDDSIYLCKASIIDKGTKKVINVAPYTVYKSDEGRVRLVLMKLDNSDIENIAEVVNDSGFCFVNPALTGRVYNLEYKVLGITYVGDWSGSKTGASNIGDIILYEGNRRLCVRVTEDVESSNSIKDIPVVSDAIYSYKGNLYRMVDYKLIPYTTNNTSVTELTIKLEQGSFDGVGNSVVSETSIRSQNIKIEEDALYVATCPNGMMIQCNYLIEGMPNRLNFSKRHESGFSIKGAKDFIRLGYAKTDGGNITPYSLTTDEKKHIKLYKIKTKSDKYDVTLAASDSWEYNKERADLVCDGENDQYLLNALLSCISDINIHLYGGHYYLNRCITSVYGKKCMLMTLDENIVPSPKNQRCISIDGENDNRLQEGNTVIVMTENGFGNMPESEESSMILVPPRSKDETSTALSQTVFRCRNLGIMGYNYTKPIVLLNLVNAQSAIVEHVSVRSDNKFDNSLYVFPTRPNEKCVGIRVGYGSNNGIDNYVKSCSVMYCGIGISCCGEHFVFEDILTHHCYVGFAFGDTPTRKRFEHPNIMVGCSIEGCYRLMLLTKQGITEDTTIADAYDPDGNVVPSTLICIGLSTETSWGIPVDEQEEGTTTQRTLPIKEVVAGAYRGRIELDYASSNPFEAGSGANMKFTAYRGGTSPDILEGRGNAE